ncbi:MULTISPECIES: Cd(II)/Pb(II)-responsive transcriptional regulator [unclassified Modicisalibacter]|uniref:Cd(II)/Pb(II)-responsive transcriptional regulator n=1 Tax=unclassified Modicisalibacter TaxID=2679913 RepID=UPI001CCAF91A|nr:MULTISPECIES: Cd(II)/Pb(II)-responsive transcriptional regulator [unclassified Modicisalibacter]MBZ9559774.1 Cd(II)/Pb(II)-responsive transcriptional regulator [Modicisalibacter sp. R2A 31.J]MBZ9577226.1 Cd(II)/Pb(II)-responsive transcriptional regulator [Modicisalibacter sp. MOD 31.J]
MKIGELARQTACQVETIRYYEREGLLPEPSRSAGNYRLYDATHVERLTFIRHCRALDMTLGEIRTLLMHRDHPERDCAEVNELIDEHIGHVETRLVQLASLRQALVDLRARCRGDGETGACGILRELAQPADEEKADTPPTTAVEHVGGTHAH